MFRLVVEFKKNYKRQKFVSRLNLKLVLDPKNFPLESNFIKFHVNLI